MCSASNKIDLYPQKLQLVVNTKNCYYKQFLLLIEKE